MKKNIFLLIVLAIVIAGIFADGVKQPITCRLIADSVGIDDNSFNGAAWRGILEYYGDTKEAQSLRGELYDVVAIATQDLFVPNLKQTVEKGYDLIITTGFVFADAVAEVATLYPEQNFIIIDAGWIQRDNLQKYTFAEEQGSFLVGALAALQAKEEGIANPKFGFIGGVPSSVITKFEVGYFQGIKYIYPDLPASAFVDYYTNDFASPQLAKMQAKHWYDSGVYAIFSAAGRGGYGTISQAKEYRENGKNVWAIGVDSDQYEEGLYGEEQSAVLTSMIKKVETAVYAALRDVENKSFEGKTICLGLDTNSVGYSDRNVAVSADTYAEVELIKEKLTNGNIAVYDTYKKALDAGVLPENLQAKDD